MMSRIRRTKPSVGDRGASAVEYGLMIAAIAAMIVGVVFGFGHVLNNTFERTTNCLSAQGGGPPFPNCPGPVTP